MSVDQRKAAANVLSPAVHFLSASRRLFSHRPSICLSRRYLSEFLKEVSLLSNLRHPNIQELVAGCTDTKAVRPCLSLTFHCLSVAKTLPFPQLLLPFVAEMLPLLQLPFLLPFY